jgi:hypothetical protein
LFPNRGKKTGPQDRASGFLMGLLAFEYRRALPMIKAHLKPAPAF